MIPDNNINWFSWIRENDIIKSHFIRESRSEIGGDRK